MATLLQLVVQDGDGRGFSELTAEGMESAHILVNDAMDHTQRGKDGSSPLEQCLSLLMERDLLCRELDRLFLYLVDWEQNNVKLDYSNLSKQNWDNMVNSLEEKHKTWIKELYNYDEFIKLSPEIKEMKKTPQCLQLKALKAQQKKQTAAMPNIIRMKE